MHAFAETIEYKTAKTYILNAKGTVALMARELELYLYNIAYCQVLSCIFSCIFDYELCYILNQQRTAFSEQLNVSDRTSS